MEFGRCTIIHLEDRNMDPDFYVSKIELCHLIKLLFVCYRNFVPISLIVTLEIVKYWQGMFMSWDVEMFDGDQDFAMKA